MFLDLPSTLKKVAFKHIKKIQILFYINTYSKHTKLQYLHFLQLFDEVRTARATKKLNKKLI